MKSYLPAMIVALIAVCAGNAIAQTDQDRRRQFVEGLLRTLVESQTRRQTQPNQVRPQPKTRPKTQRPISPELRNARAQLTQFSDETSRLLQGLSADSQRSPAARAHMGEMLKVNARAKVLFNRSQQVDHIDHLVDDFRELDGQWRSLSYQLQQAEGLSASCVQCVGRVNAHAKSLCGVFHVQPQIDRNLLLQRVHKLHIEVGNLKEDLAFERISRSPALILQAVRLQQQVDYVAAAVTTGRSREIVAGEFKKYQVLSQPFTTAVWALNNRYLERSLRRIEQAERDIRETLLLPQPINRRQLQHLTHVLTDDVEALFNSVTLNVLIELPSSRNILNTAGEFYGVVENFHLSVEDGSTPIELRKEFGYIEHAWPELAYCFSGSRNTEVQQLLKGIEQTFLSMRDALLIRPQVDRRRAIQVAGNLELLAGHLLEDIEETVHDSGRYPEEFCEQTHQDCGSFVTTSKQLHEGLLKNIDSQRLRTHCAAMSRCWTRLYEDRLKKLQRIDQANLHHVNAQIVPLVVELRTMFEF